MERNKPEAGQYNIHPVFPLADGEIFKGYASLAKRLRNESLVVVDGYSGVYFERFRDGLNRALVKEGITARWIDIQTASKPEPEILAMTAAFLGGDDPLFGTRTTLVLTDFFDQAKLRALSLNDAGEMTIVYGCGGTLSGSGDPDRVNAPDLSDAMAATRNGTLSGSKDPDRVNSPAKPLLLYIDLPKYEIQLRSRKGQIKNLGHDKPLGPKAMYKTFYFVDWVVLNRHKANIIKDIDIFIDGQYPEEPTWMAGDDARLAMNTLSRNTFRVKPWFEPGVWGGSWIKDHIPALPQDVPNYAWSFELIVPENGLVMESSGNTLELSFDSLMFLEAPAVLGDAYERFGFEFPIRFDFLDTFDGGNLSVQCHPRPDYMKKHFGEDFTQEECYYILDSKENAPVYLGFQEDIEPENFQDALETSFREEKAIDIERFVQKLPARKHDFFLIPYGTIHGSGVNNLVLEISSTPYIFTFKIYDWMRPDLDGKPRPLNIQRGMDNLYFGRKGKVVEEELISRPVLLEKGKDWSLFHLPTHSLHLYDVHRYHFQSEIRIETKGKCHVLSLVEGQSIMITTANGMKQRYNYAETFVVPAAAGRYTIENESKTEAMVVLAFVK